MMLVVIQLVNMKINIMVILIVMMIMMLLVVVIMILMKQIMINGMTKRMMGIMILMAPV